MKEVQNENELSEEKLDEDEISEEDELWEENSFAETISSKDAEKIGRLIRESDGPKKWECKKCKKPINEHNLVLHKGMCDNCFFDEYGM